jgi:hypothetical protein
MDEKYDNMEKSSANTTNYFKKAQIDLAERTYKILERELGHAPSAVQVLMRMAEKDTGVQMLKKQHPVWTEKAESKGVLCAELVAKLLARDIELDN